MYVLGRIEGYKAIPDPFNKLYTSPESIRLCRSLGYPSVEEYWSQGGYWTANSSTFDKWADLGAVYGGDWDEKTLKFNQLPKYVGMKEHFISGIPWKETSLFDYYRQLLDRGYRIDGCESESELMDRYERIEEMCNEIQSSGYKKREEICDNGNLQCLMHEVPCNIGREGELIFCGNGFHRLSAAKIFDVDMIPIKIIVRHKQWQKIRDNIYDNSLAKEHKDLRDHPDLQDILSEDQTEDLSNPSSRR